MILPYHAQAAPRYVMLLLGWPASHHPTKGKSKNIQAADVTRDGSRAGMAQRPPPPHVPFARRVISALQQNICACACSKSRSPSCSCWIVPLWRISANPWRQTGIRFISSLISTRHRARVFRDRSKHWWHLLWIFGVLR